MQDFIARLNIERFQKLISEEADTPHRDRLKLMLVEEQARLRACEPDSETTPPRDGLTGAPIRQQQ